MKIYNCKIQDIDQIFNLYESATSYQKVKKVVSWPNFDSVMVSNEIKEKRQWKIVIDHKVACVWATTDNDAQIWKTRNEDPAIYIHRIATNPDFRGQNLVKEIVKWARAYTIENNKRYLRMDTVGENVGLINYYKKCGFDFLGLSQLKHTEGLPAHYYNATVSLFQMSV